ncbi:hypothetical protein [Mesorhizobium sp. Cs1321R2N1]|uniref:hypothetical protein n=1 Tax=Mesorhizobium sp. Cs1321R2N1 TaxID=3015174 RepID=UPI00301DE9EE
MKTFALNDRGQLKARDLLNEIVKQPIGGTGRAATTLDQMRLDIRLMDKLEAVAGQCIELEDADWNHLSAKVRSFPFAFADRDILAFCDDVLNAGEPTPKTGS